MGKKFDIEKMKKLFSGKKIEELSQEDLKNEKDRLVDLKSKMSVQENIDKVQEDIDYVNSLIK